MPPPLLVSNVTNIRYLSGVSMTAGLMLLKGRQRLLFVDNRYTEKAQEGVRGTIEVRHIDELKKVLKRLKRVRFEADDVTVARLARWKKQFRGTRFVPSTHVVEEWRREKKLEELKAITKACRITDRVLQAVPRMLKRGMSEKELAWQIEKMSHELGADAMAFETIVAFGQNTSRPHHRPTSKKLRRGDLVQIDMGVRVDGYCSDCSRVLFTGKPTKEQQQVFDLLKKIVKETTKLAKAGASNRALDAYARKTLKKYGWDTYFLHSLGHGVGLEIHEGLNISSKAKKTKLLLNEVITTEPGIYFAGKWGMRIEDTVVVGKMGGKPLNKAKISILPVDIT